MSTKTPGAVVITALACAATGWVVLTGLGCAGDDDAAREEDREKAIRRLEALPYVSATPVSPEEKDTAGVTLHDPARTYLGVNLFHDFKRALLMNMDGDVLHTWDVQSEGPLHHVELAHNGDLLVVVKDWSLMRLDGDSRVLWRLPGRFHHDIAEDHGGNLYALTRMSAWIDFEGVRLPILDDRILILSGDAQPIEEISIGSLAGNHISRAQLEEAKLQFESESAENQRVDGDSVFDMFHTNSIELLPDDILGVGARGNVLVCFRELDEIAVLDLDERKLVWSWGEGVLDSPHHAIPLERGRILVFDNGRKRGHTRILVMNATTGAIEWEHRGTPPSSLFSRVMGSAQPLPNGNLLITDSVRGRVLEITADHEIVWEWFNRLTTPDDGFGEQTQRLTIYRMERLSPDSAP